MIENEFFFSSRLIKICIKFSIVKSTNKKVRSSKMLINREGISKIGVATRWK